MSSSYVCTTAIITTGLTLTYPRTQFEGRFVSDAMNDLVHIYSYGRDGNVQVRFARWQMCSSNEHHPLRKYIYIQFTYCVCSLLEKARILRSVRQLVLN